MWGLFLKLVIGLAASVIYAALSYRKPTETISAEDDVGFNKAEEGSEIGKAFGTVWIDAASVAWHGDLSAQAIVVSGPRRFGIVGPRSRTTVGYKYSLGVHFVPCLGPVDKLLEIKVEEKRAWIGGALGLAPAGDLITIDEPELFGGEKREGGIKGSLNFLSGYALQGRNDYLQGVLGASVPAFCGVASVILRRMYLGTSAYLKPWRFKTMRVYVGDGGAEQWLPFYAGIPAESGLALKPSSILIQMDISSRSCGFANDSILIDGYTSLEETRAIAVEALARIRESLDFATGPVDVGLAFFRHSNGAVDQNNNPDGVVPFSITPLGLPVLPRRGLMVKLAATKADLDDLIAYAQTFVVVPDTALSATLGATYENALDFFTATGSGDTRANYVVSSFSTQDSDSVTRSIVFGLNELLAGGIKGGVVLGAAPDAKETDYFLPSSLSNWGFTNMTLSCIQLSSGSNDWAYGRFDGPALNPAAVDDYGGLCGNPADTFDGRLSDGLVADGAQILSIGQVNSGIFAGRMFTNLVFVRTGAGPQKLFDTSTGNLVDDNRASIVDNLPIDTDGVDGLPFAPAQFESGANWLNMNPAHILREVLIARDTNGSGDDAEIGPSFGSAAVALFDEGFGLSLFWRNTSDKQDFISEVERHIDGRIYQDRRSGLWELRLIRSDYDVDALPVFDRSNVVEWGDDIAWPDPSSLPNQVTIVYTDWRKDEPGSITLTNPARVQALGKIINRKAEYPGITSGPIARRVALRDLSALSAPLLTGTIRARHVDPSLNLGSPIVLNNPRLKIDNVVVRITDLVDGDGRDNSVSIRFVEDRFTLPATDLVFIEDVTIPDSSTALPVVDRLVEESSYWQIASEGGQEAVDAYLETAPGAGWLTATGGQPSGAAVSFRLYADQGAGYVEQDGEFEFCPTSVLRSAMSDRADQTKALVETAGLEGVSIGSLAAVGSEYLRVDAIEAGVWTDDDYWAPAVEPVAPVSLVTFGRGCLDTSPVPADVGATVFFWQAYADAANAVFADGQSVGAKLRTETMSGLLASGLAPVDTVEFASRAVRPYPPGKVQIDAVYSAPETWAGTLTLSWAHRSRLLQISDSFDDHTAADIGPEAGTTYRVVVQALDFYGLPLGAALLDVDAIAGTSYSLDTTTMVPPAGAWGVRVEVSAERDGYGSLRNRQIEIPLLITPALLPSAAWLDVNDLGSVWQDRGFTVPVTTDGDPVGLISNQRDSIL